MPIPYPIKKEEKGLPYTMKIPKTVQASIKTEIDLLDRRRIRVSFEIENSVDSPLEKLEALGEIEILKVGSINTPELHELVLGKGLFENMNHHNAQLDLTEPVYVFLYHYKSIPSYYALVSRRELFQFLEILPLPNQHHGLLRCFFYLDLNRDPTFYSETLSQENSTIEGTVELWNKKL